MNEKRPLKETSTDDLLREAAARQDLPDAVSRLGGKALLFEAGKPEWHVSIPAAASVVESFSRPGTSGSHKA